MSGAQDTIQLEITLLAQRLGIALDEAELKLAASSYLRSHQSLTQLQEALTTEQEPAVFFTRLIEWGRK